MIDEIMDVVIRRLNELFPGYSIDTDGVKQSPEAPYFSVNLLELSRKPMLGGRFFQQNRFCIRFFPDASQGNQDLYRVLGVLMDGLEYITLQDGSILHGTGQSSRMEAEILNYFVNYNLFLTRREEPAELMGSVEVKGEVVDEAKRSGNTGV